MKEPEYVEEASLCDPMRCPNCGWKGILDQCCKPQKKGKDGSIIGGAIECPCCQETGIVRRRRNGDRKYDDR